MKFPTWFQEVAKARATQEALEAKVDSLAEEVVGKDVLIERLREEGSKTKASLDLSNRVRVSTGI